jgi:hypothetical protein
MWVVFARNVDPKYIQKVDAGVMRFPEVALLQ